MANVSQILQADALRWSANLRFDAPPALAALIPHYSSAQACVIKPFGLSVTVNSVSALGFPAPLSFPVTFSGQIETAGSPAPGNSDPPIVRWTVNEQVNQDFVLNGTTIHVDRLDGFERTEIVDIAEVSGNACDGTRRTFTSLMGWLRSFGEGYIQGTDLVLHLTIGQEPVEVPIAIMSLYVLLADAPAPSRRPSEPDNRFTYISPAILVDGSGIEIAGRWLHHVPSGPGPIDRALDDAILATRLAILSQGFADVAVRSAVRRAALHAATASLRGALVSSEDDQTRMK
jgi:hypothetical protein